MFVSSSKVGTIHALQSIYKGDLKAVKYFYVLYHCVVFVAFYCLED